MYHNAHLSTLPVQATEDVTSEHQAEPKLAFSRAYSLCLSPQIIYARSTLLSQLVASKSHRQLEFLAVGSWWFYESLPKSVEAREPHCSAHSGDIDIAKGHLIKVPGNKEDVFSDNTIDRKAKRALTNFLRFATDAVGNRDVMNDWGTQLFDDFLIERFGLPPRLRAAIHALTLLPGGPRMATTSEALRRISQHLSSIGVFGPGFNAVVPKWGGLGEIVQVACRAGAVGGGIYALGKGIQKVQLSTYATGVSTTAIDETMPPLTINLDDGSKIQTSWLVGCQDDLPHQAVQAADAEEWQAQHNISIAASSLSKLFTSSREGTPPSAVAVITFPAGSIIPSSSPRVMGLPPVYITAHSSDSGECPDGQCEYPILRSIECPLLMTNPVEYLSTLSDKTLTIITSDSLIKKAPILNCQFQRLHNVANTLSNRCAIHNCLGARTAGKGIDRRCLA